MDGLRNVEYLPEPNEPRVVSAVDPSIAGYEDEWRSGVTGWLPSIVRPIGQTYRPFAIFSRAFALALFASLLVIVWRFEWLIIELPPPKSEWAFDDTGIRELQEIGLDGSGVNVCMVDTGIDFTHDAFEGLTIVFKDFVGGSSSPVEYGAIAHGTLMAGILLGQNHQLGAAPSVNFAMVAALREDANGMNTGEESIVADAIRWCHEVFDADIISLSLGGMHQNEQEVESRSVSATRQVTDKGVYVVAAAGNDGGVDDDGDVSSPGNVPRVITVGAHDRLGNVWVNSSIGNQTLSDGSSREHPHLKPEIIAPGVQIVSTGEQNAWYSSSGTSDSTVFVTGVLALILQEHPQFKHTSTSNGQCIDAVKMALMRSTANDGVAPQHDSKSGYGVLNAAKWLEEVGKISSC